MLSIDLQIICGAVIWKHQDFLHPTTNHTMALSLTLGHVLLIQGLYQRHALKAFRASVGDEEGHRVDCVLAQWVLQHLKKGKAKHLTK